MKIRFVFPIGTRAHLRRYWDGACGRSTYHNAMAYLADSGVVNDPDLGGSAEDHPLEAWPRVCEDCGELVPENATRQVFRKTLYGANDSWQGFPVPGDVYYADWYECDQRGGKCIYGWTNCDGRHVIVVLPDKHTWDTSGRASNCTMREDTTHRCWVVSGSAENGTLHVDKNGQTCKAGGGSIVTSQWHGFLHSGQLKKC